ncbi:MAG TPA: hypothetical protein DCR06_00290 [Planctomycetaceae bacterium]|nr:hypothetical protein [Planctomycetaceae bacterium]HAU48657.1 hypothetical protein [Planctomycetaceae bacterium]
MKGISLPFEDLPRGLRTRIIRTLPLHQNRNLRYSASFGPAGDLSWNGFLILKAYPLASI